MTKAHDGNEQHHDKKNAVPNNIDSPTFSHIHGGFQVGKTFANFANIELDSVHEDIRHLVQQFEGINNSLLLGTISSEQA